VDIQLLLLILFALLIGWLFGHFGKKKQKQDQQFNFSSCSETYIEGLNYLLSNESDKAIKLFIELIEVDKETIETHIALGNLFRTKGEVDRAIKIHQSLLARPNLEHKQRYMAIAELANDYLKSGLLDRAENLYKEMLQINPNDEMVMRKLLDLYLLENSWTEAAEMAQKLVDLGDADSVIILSHSLCELAESCLQKGHKKRARQYLNQAINAESNCIRAALKLIDMDLQTKDLVKARSRLLNLIKNKPQFIDLYITPAKNIFSLDNDLPGFQQLLHKQYQSSHSSRVALALLESYREHKQNELIEDFLNQVLDDSPSMEIFDFALKLYQSNPENMAHSWQNLSGYLHNLSIKKIEYICAQCGYGSHSMQWHCPSCNSWSTLKPI